MTELEAKLLARVAELEQEVQELRIAQEEQQITSETHSHARVKKPGTGMGRRRWEELFNPHN